LETKACRRYCTTSGRCATFSIDSLRRRAERLEKNSGVFSFCYCMKACLSISAHQWHAARGPEYVLWTSMMGSQRDNSTSMLSTSPTLDSGMAKWEESILDSANERLLSLTTQNYFPTLERTPLLLTRTQISSPVIRFNLTTEQIETCNDPRRIHRYAVGCHFNATMKRCVCAFTLFPVPFHLLPLRDPRSHLQAGKLDRSLRRRTLLSQKLATLTGKTLLRSANVWWNCCSQNLTNLNLLCSYWTRKTTIMRATRGRGRASWQYNSVRSGNSGENASADGEIGSRNQEEHVKMSFEGRILGNKGQSRKTNRTSKWDFTRGMCFS
jgi:hypothetical protein